MYCSCCLIILIATVIGGEVGGENTLQFLVVGDWGGIDTPPYYTSAQLHVARQMGKTAEEVGAEFTITVGDNFYSNGVQNVDDPRFKETFEVSHEFILLYSCYTIIPLCARLAGAANPLRWRIKPG